MKGNKIAQISIFIMLGFVVLLGAALIYYFDADPKPVPLIPDFAVPVKTYVDECIKQTASSTSFVLGMQGGYNALPERSVATFSSTVPLYYDRGASLVPPKKKTATELASLIDLNLDSCLNFSIFEEQGYFISKDRIETSVTLNDNDALLEIEMPLTIERGETATAISSFSYVLPVRLGHLIDVARGVTETIVEEPFYIGLSYLLEQDVDISVMRKDECTDVYVMFDNQSRSLGNTAYIFLFAAQIEDEYCRLDLSEETSPRDEEPDNHAPAIEPIPDLIATIGEPFAFQVEANDPEQDSVLFLDDSDLFVVHPLKGIIGFTPTAVQKGMYEITLTAVDINGNANSMTFALEIQ